MHYGIEIVPFGDFANPNEVVKLAQLAEESGWEAIWLWDHLLFPYGAGDPWVTLSAIAAHTQRIKLITGVSPLPRYKPHVLARTLISLDLLSEGRLVFGTGAGVDFDFVPLGEAKDPLTRAAMLDEGLELIDLLLRGDEFSFRGNFYQAENVRLVPAPLQKPRPPIWIGGDSRAALRRASRWDGWIIGTVAEDQTITKPPQALADQVAYIHRFLDHQRSFEIAVDGITPDPRSGLPAEYASAGATWFFEIIYQSRAPHTDLLQRIKAGPPV